jgi:hypothetical protein
MAEELIRVAEDFWNIRGRFRLGGVVDIGTQASLIRLSGERFLFLDAYTPGRAVQREIDEVIGSDGVVEAVLHLHPFHTLHAEKMHRRYPEARLYGTQRHLDRFPHLPWEAERCEDPELHEIYRQTLAFTVPRGVDFISGNENVHFSSVLALHRSSGTIHSDDTLMCAGLPGPLRKIGGGQVLFFHPTLSLALEKRAGAVDEFRAWADELIKQWGDAERLCAAHAGVIMPEPGESAPLRPRLRRALKGVALPLRLHHLRYG